MENLLDPLINESRNLKVQRPKHGVRSGIMDDEVMQGHSTPPNPGSRALAILNLSAGIRGYNLFGAWGSQCHRPSQSMQRSPNYYTRMKRGRTPVVKKGGC